MQGAKSAENRYESRETGGFRRLRSAQGAVPAKLATVDLHRTSGPLMKIRSITALPVNIPFRAPYRFSYGSIASLTKTVIELEPTDGRCGPW
jgi:hypothetical protein